MFTADVEASYICKYLCAPHGWGTSPTGSVSAASTRPSRSKYYPNGRLKYTSLRKHMKELVDEIIADARLKGYGTTRKRSGPSERS